MTNWRQSSAALAAGALLLAGCVPIGDEALPKDAFARGQRTLLLVFASPGPIYTEDDNKAETAAKIVPGLGLVVKSAQDDTSTQESKDLQRYLTPWDPAAEFAPILAKEMRENSGHPGKWIELSDVPELTPDKLQAYNRSGDVLDWQLRYYIESPDQPVPRNYSTLLSIDDALIFEVDLEWGVATGDQDAATPTLTALTKLVQVDTSHAIWRHEDTVSDTAGARTNYEFRAQPDDLTAKWRKLMPTLAKIMAANYRKSLQAAGLFKMPSNGITPLSASTATASAAMPYGMTALPYGMTPDMTRPATVHRDAATPPQVSAPSTTTP